MPVGKAGDLEDVGAAEPRRGRHRRTKSDPVLLMGKAADRGALIRSTGEGVAASAVKEASAEPAGGGGGRELDGGESGRLPHLVGGTAGDGEEDGWVKMDKHRAEGELEVSPPSQRVRNRRSARAKMEQVVLEVSIDTDANAHRLRSQRYDGRPSRSLFPVPEKEGRRELNDGSGACQEVQCGSQPSELCVARKEEEEEEDQQQQQQQQQQQRQQEEPSRPALNDEACGSDPGAEYAIVHGIGSGGFSMVFLVKHMASHEISAMKVVPKTSGSNPLRYKRRVYNEVMAMLEIPASPFLHQCKRAFEDATSVYLVTDYFPGGDLLVHLNHCWTKNRAGFGERRTRDILAEIILGISHMHAHGYIHRDIKIENIMADQQGHLKLIDFGISQKVSDGTRVGRAAGSLMYMPPELLLEGVVGVFTDWWAVGILAHELMTGFSPWSTMEDSAELRKQITSIRVAPPACLSRRAGQLICAFLKHDTASRLGSTAGIYEIQVLPFFMSLDWEMVEGRQNPPPVSTSMCPIDRDASRQLMHEYKAMEEESNAFTSGAANWSLGLPEAVTRPRVL